jgi:hypothetical protein
MRAAAYQLVSENEELRSMGFTAESVHRSLGTESPEERPFIVMSWGNEDVAFRGTGTEQLQVWVYDEPGSFDRIDKALDVIERLFTDSTHVQDGAGGYMSAADWRGRSADLFDDIFRCATRYGQVTVTGRA